MRKLCFTVLLFHGLTTAIAQQYSNTVKEQITRVENNLSGGVVMDGYHIQERMKHYNVTGLSIAVIDNYQIVWAKGYGYADKKENRKVTTNTLFEPGSISKSLNAIGVLQLAQHGKLNLHEDINRYLTSWTFPYDTLSNNKKITTAQLLSHTAGVSVYGFPGYERNSIIPGITEILDGKYPANTPPIRSLTEPGTAFSYSGGGILISQQILTDITQQPYEQFMYKNVLKPLGMSNSFYNQPPPADQQKNLATGYERNGAEVPGKYFVYPEKAAAGLWTTPTDIGKYIIEMQLAYKGLSSKVLNQEIAGLHLTPYGDESAAMGTFLQDRNGEKYFFHDARNQGFSGFYIAGLTNGKGVVLFVNSEDGTILLELLNSIALVYDWEGFAKPQQIKGKSD
ncbi:serine hydrolase domain-containing protein [Moheibacter sediminis]|uniref:CubicO group peptidase, beta-lactamase class C family n=1 Tax=Moheibacter sediminis TaxID=1434700 RepID=A0A1W1Z1M2_9FLAO|nr:serine hydrolase domain-containing protein [Moheibacter sediminis]SMC42350.1 CubicO group peptidase, beta-lactamase class C family [Moheibacter sediminis]